MHVDCRTRQPWNNHASGQMRRSSKQEINLWATKEDRESNLKAALLSTTNGTLTPYDGSSYMQLTLAAF